MRDKKFVKNTVTSLMLQIVTIICGFILPRLIISNYGSAVNGLVNSIAQFLAAISLLDLGMGAVVQSSLYKPLADKNNNQISNIVASSDNFFKKISVILFIYMLALIVFYPFIFNGEYDFWYTATLIFAMGINSLTQYFFGMTDRLFLSADQRGYIFSSVQIIAVVLNTAIGAILIGLGASIQMLKFATACIYVLRPIIVRLYINRNYQIKRNTKYYGEPIQQKWNGISQHISYFVLEGTDAIVLTLFATLSDVSVYSVYNLVINGIKQLFSAMLAGYRSLLGELWAKKESVLLERYYILMEWTVHVSAMFLWGCTTTLILPFIKLYTRGVTDVDYIVPCFAGVIIFANMIHSLRTPYNTMILAAGHYKQTQKCYIIAAMLNIVISIVLVFAYGLIGVAIGTLVAMAYQTIWMALYCYKNLVYVPKIKIVKQLMVDAITLILILTIGSLFKMKEISYISFLLLCIEVAIVALLVLAVVNLIFYRDKIMIIFKKE